MKETRVAGTNGGVCKYSQISSYYRISRPKQQESYREETERIRLQFYSSQSITYSLYMEI